jgi:hypothetical protein
MKIQNCIYNNLISLGIDMNTTPDFSYSKAGGNFSLAYWPECKDTKNRDSDLFSELFKAHCRVDHGQSVFDPVILFWVSEKAKIAGVYISQWGETKERFSLALDAKVKWWLDQQLAEGHRFLRKEDWLVKELKSILNRY